MGWEDSTLSGRWIIGTVSPRPGKFEAACTGIPAAIPRPGGLPPDYAVQLLVSESLR